MFQKYISRITAETLNKLLIAINKIAISEGLEDIKSLRVDSTVVVFSVTKRKEILGENIPSAEKIFSIYEPHTDIIVKGGREVQFGHKINIAGGRSNLILDCEVLDGNPVKEMAQWDRSGYIQLQKKF